MRTLPLSRQPDLFTADADAATLAELRFDSIAGWLPAEEAAALRGEFHRELDRLYRLEVPT